MILFPKLYLKNVLDISIALLQKENIKGLLIDVDNTLLYLDKTLLKGVEEWVENMKKNGIKICILSNTNQKDKVEKLGKQLQIPYVYFAKKPFKSGFKKGAKILELPCQQIAVVGDQITTDVWGANRMKMFSILTKPLEEKDIWITKIKRPFDAYIINKYLERK